MGDIPGIPPYLMDRSVYIGRELAWPYMTIPALIEFIRSIGYISLGGDLQFVFPDGRFCECNNIGLYLYDENLSGLSNSEAVEYSAEWTLSAFSNLGGEAAFIDEGMKGFSDLIQPEIEAGIILSMIYFTWTFRRPRVE